jgi:hypothetical protein
MRRSERLHGQWALYDERQFDRACKETQAILATLQAADLQDAQRILGKCAYLQHRDQEAVQFLRKACQASDDSNDWLGLALAAVRAGQAELGAQAFEQVRICQQAAKFAQWPGIHLQVYWYALALCDMRQWFALAPLLDELKGVYKRLHCTDTAFVYRHGLPLLASALQLAARYFNAHGGRAAGVAWLQDLASGVDAEGGQEAERTAGELKEPVGK